MKWADFTLDLIYTIEEIADQYKEKFKEKASDARYMNIFTELVMDEIYAQYDDCEKVDEIIELMETIIKPILDGKEIDIEALKSDEKIKTLFENVIINRDKHSLWLIKEAILFKDYF